MGKIRMLALSFVAIHFVACSKTSNNELGGEDVTQQFLEEYSGSYEEQTSDSGEQITLWRDGEIEVLKHRQVGSDHNPAIPNPTYCSFTMNGHVAAVIQLSDESRKKTSGGKIFESPATHNLVFTVHQVSLTDELQKGTTSNQGCLNFQEQMNQKLPIYTYGMELYGAGTIRLHTRDDGDYNGTQRTESTLDEVFIRN